MKKKIWILNHYAGSMYYNKGGRHYWFAKFLRSAGYEPIVFASNSKHGKYERYIDTDDLWTEQRAEEIHVPFVFVNARMYTGNGKQRVMNMIDFYRHIKKAAREYAAVHGEPDIIYASSVHPLTLVAGIQLAKHFGVKCICEMRDLWPEAIVAYSKKLKKSDPLVKILYQGEKWIYTKADALIFTQEGGLDYIRKQGWDKEHGGSVDLSKAYHINNGVDLEAFDGNLKEFWYEDPELDDPAVHKVIYTGSIRRINNLGIILDAAKLINDPTIRFMIFGSGDELEELKMRVTDEQIKNVVFKGEVNKRYIPSIVKRADLNLVHWEMNPMVCVGESYNKAFEYYAAGKPVFYTIRPGYSIAEKYHCGCLTDGFTAQNIADSIQKMLSMPENEKLEMGKNARHVAELYDFKELTNDLIRIIEHI